MRLPALVVPDLHRAPVPALQLPRDGEGVLVRSTTQGPSAREALGQQVAPTLAPGARATVTFTAPDNLTAFRLMAVAADRSGARFGSGESRITILKPLLLAPVLPRFLTAGDRAGLVVGRDAALDQDPVARQPPHQFGVAPACQRHTLVLGTAAGQRRDLRAHLRGKTAAARPA